MPLHKPRAGTVYGYRPRTGNQEQNRAVTVNTDKFPKRLRKARGTRTMQEVAVMVGLTSRQAYQAYESGRVVPTIDLCERLAAALGVAPAWLAGWE